MALKMITIYSILSKVSKIYPETIKFLSAKARWIVAAQNVFDDAVKTEADYLKRIIALVKSVYAGDMAGDFIDAMAAVISRQIFLAHQDAWKDAGGSSKDFPDYLRQSADEIILREFDHVDQFYRDIVNARIDRNPIEPLLSRAELWAARYADAYSTAALLIAEQQGTESGKPINLIWKLGNTEEHCEICDTLNEVIAPASVWREANIFPQSGQDGTLPNPALVSHHEGQNGCGGWRCDCGLKQTDEPATITIADDLRKMIGW